ncbi:MAG: peptidylprolyl isomerase [Oscillospiraceae bacterium]|jgi:peptidyl-prolyl cis-trans isomerase B (cyclophilin B)|nr:peptidylprolyl isomerase [Oscillospiraceae bacterium]
MKSTIKRVFAAALALSLAVGVSACKKDDVEGAKEKAKLLAAGNIKGISVDQEPGDIFAEVEIYGYGIITFKLFPLLAPKSVEQFCSLAERGFYDTRNIHRVISDMVMQGGSLNFDGSDGSVTEAELVPLEASDYARNFYGALVLAPDSTEMSYCQFYVVNSKKPADIDDEIKQVDELLANTETPLNGAATAVFTKYRADLAAIPDDVKEKYKASGGLYRMDGHASVIGQAIDGFEVIDAIAAAEVVAGNKADDADGVMSRPMYDIIIKSVKITRIPYPETTTSPPEEETKKSKKSKSTTAAESIDTSVTILTDEPETMSPDSEVVNDISEAEPDAISDDETSSTAAPETETTTDTTTEASTSASSVTTTTKDIETATEPADTESGSS